MITIYTIAYNEEVLLQFMINHYRDRFPGCRIVIYDNISTDNTVKIALKNQCEIVPFDTDNQINELFYMQVKNNCWKEAKTDWVLICDVDELLDINEAHLKNEETQGVNIIQDETWDMINMQDNWDIGGIKYGTLSPLPGKTLLFNKRYIKEINYGPGAHDASPVGSVSYSKKIYKLYHFWAINEARTYEKYITKGPRLSPENIKNGWGADIVDWLGKDTRKLIHEEYVTERKNAVKVR